MPLLIVLALVGVPILELYLIVQVSHGLGVLPTLVLLVALSVLGGVLLRREGAKAWQAFRQALNDGRLPATEVADGALVILGGALLLTPGFATDAVGLACVLPPSRAVLRRLLTAVVARRLGAGAVLGGYAGSQGVRWARRRRGPDTAAGSAGRPSGANGAILEGEVLDEHVDRPLPDDPPTH